MSVGQLGAVELTAFMAVGQLAYVELETDAIEASAGQLGRVEVTTPAYTTVSLGPNLVCDGLEQLVLDATWSGATPTSWTWSIQSDSSIGGSPFERSATIAPAGDSATFTAPAAEEGATVIVGVVAHNGTTSSPLAYVTITVYPHLEWTMSGGVWVPQFLDDL